MKLEFGTVIPAGIAMSVTTWENDGDEYQTNTLYNLTREEVQYWVNLLKWFTSNEQDLGNEDYNNSAFVERLFEEQEMLSPAITKKFFDIDVPALDAEDGEELDMYFELCDEKENDICDALQKVLGDPVQYDYDFCRVVDGIKIFDIKEDIVIPDAPKAEYFVDGSYGKEYNNEVIWND